MATLEKRVQVLLSAEQYARVEAAAKRAHVSVGAYVREAIDERLDRKRSDAKAALERLWAWADEHPMPAITEQEWSDHKDDLLDRPALTGI
jgi:hypothetical protein